VVQPRRGAAELGLADDALAIAAKGILFESRLAAGGTNLVVFSENLAAADTLQVYDPAGALPKNQDSWR
jgi:RES domain-containing protein